MERDLSTTPDVALVVGAGGPTGGPFIWSALHALESHTGWAPTMAKTIVGTSAGAFVAARMGERTDSTASAVEQLIALGNADAYRPALRTQVGSVVRTLGGHVIAFVAPTKRPFADYQVPAGPFHAGASAITVQRRSGKRHRHELALVTDSTAVVQASAAIPFVNKPVKLNGSFHVDGAVHSANNVDVVDPATHPVIVVVSPMIPASGGSTMSRFHRAQLRCELLPWMQHGRTAVVVMPSAEAHANRRDREFYEPQGARSVERLI